MTDAGAGERSTSRIVVGVDGSSSSELALRWAASQAGLTGQELHAVISWDVPLPYDVPIASEFDWHADATAALGKSVENVLGGPDAPAVSRHVTQGRPAKVLIDAGRDADLLVVGSRGHGGLTGQLLGSVSQHVLTHASCSVVVVHEHAMTTGRIVVGVDGSPESTQALRWAACLAALTGSELHAVMVWHVPLAFGLVAQAEPDWPAHSSRVLAATAADVLGEKDASRVVQDVVEGYPADALLGAARDADLLVVGCRGRGGFAGLLLGSVSRHVAAHAPCPVVVHRGDASSAALP